jgi:lactoylglutathione lyase
MNYFHTMVRISDIDESLDFYCNKLGLREVRRIDDEKGRYTNIFLACPSDQKEGSEAAAGEQSERLRDYTATLELTYNWPPEDGSTPEVYTGGRNFGHLAYQVDDIYKTCQRLMDAGVTINRPPRDGRMAFIKSPDGISIELLQKSGSLPPTEPWMSMENEGTW